MFYLRPGRINGIGVLQCSRRFPSAHPVEKFDFHGDGNVTLACTVFGSRGAKDNNRPAVLR
jgi:hypothetical protein